MAVANGILVGEPDEIPDAYELPEGTEWLKRTDGGGSVLMEVKSDQWIESTVGDANDRAGKAYREGIDLSDADIHSISTIPPSLAELDADGELLSSQLPDLAITSTYVVADKTERLSLDVQEGDVAIQQDTDETHIFTGGDPSNDADWGTFQSPAAPIQTVFGRTGNVAAQSGDYTLSQIADSGLEALLVDTEANKPTAGTADRWFFATDTSILYRDDGATWNAIAGAGTASSKLPTQHAETLDFNRTKEPQVTASEGTSYTADLLQSDVHKVTMTGDVSFDVSNVDTAVVNQLVLFLVQDSTGGRTPSFTPTVRWPGGSAPSWSTSAAAVDVVTLIYDPDAGAWDGFPSGLGMA